MNSITVEDKLPTAATIEAARAYLEQVPYFTYPAMLALKQLPADHLPADMAARVAIEFADPLAMPQELDRQAFVFDNFYPDEKRHTPSTMDTIDTFLATFGTADDRETDALTKKIFSVTPDYAAVLAAEERASLPSEQEMADTALSEQDKLINSFIAGTHEAPSKPKSDKLTNEQPAAGVTPEKRESSPLTESLVRVLVKNHNYSKAIEIISELSLKNPKKSIYFADQIRFLRKLIINENKK